METCDDVFVIVVVVIFVKKKGGATLQKNVSSTFPTGRFDFYAFSTFLRKKKLTIS